MLLLFERFSGGSEYPQREWCSDGGLTRPRSSFEHGKVVFELR